MYLKPFSNIVLALIIFVVAPMQAGETVSLNRTGQNVFGFPNRAHAFHPNYSIQLLSRVQPNPNSDLTQTSNPTQVPQPLVGIESAKKPFNPNLTPVSASTTASSFVSTDSTLQEGRTPAIYCSENDCFNLAGTCTHPCSTSSSANLSESLKPVRRVTWQNPPISQIYQQPLSPSSPNSDSSSYSASPLSDPSHTPAPSFTTSSSTHTSSTHSSVVDVSPPVVSPSPLSLNISSTSAVLSEIMPQQKRTATTLSSFRGEAPNSSCRQTALSLLLKQNGHKKLPLPSSSTSSVTSSSTTPDPLASTTLVDSSSSSATADLTTTYNTTKGTVRSKSSYNMTSQEYPILVESCNLRESQTLLEHTSSPYQENLASAPSSASAVSSSDHLEEPIAASIDDFDAVIGRSSLSSSYQMPHETAPPEVPTITPSQHPSSPSDASSTAAADTRALTAVTAGAALSLAKNIGGLCGIAAAGGVVIPHALVQCGVKKEHADKAALAVTMGGSFVFQKWTGNQGRADMYLLAALLLPTLGSYVLMKQLPAKDQEHPVAQEVFQRLYVDLKKSVNTWWKSGQPTTQAILFKRGSDAKSPETDKKQETTKKKIVTRAHNSIKKLCTRDHLKPQRHLLS